MELTIAEKVWGYSLITKAKRPKFGQYSGPRFDVTSWDMTEAYDELGYLASRSSSVAAQAARAYATQHRWPKLQKTDAWWLVQRLEGTRAVLKSDLAGSGYVPLEQTACPSDAPAVLAFLLSEYWDISILPLYPAANASDALYADTSVHEACVGLEAFLRQLQKGWRPPHSNFDFEMQQRGLV